MVTDRRRIKRTTAGQPAALLLRDQDAFHRCSVRNLTETGARIRLPRDFDRRLPHSFELTFDGGRTMRDCVVVWRDGNEVGVEWTHRMRAPVNA